MSEAVVKVDSELIKRIEEFMKQPDNRLIYASKKQVADIAILEFLNSRKLSKMKKGGKDGRR